MTIGLTTLGVAGITVVVCLLVARRMFRPLDALRESADRLKDADGSGAVPCTERGDDIGRLARALASLRAASLEKSRIEAEVEEQRRALALRDVEDRRAQDAAAAKQLEVVAQLAAGLEHLSSGDLAFRLDRPFAASYEKLRADFNGALATVAGTLHTIAQAADSIRATTSTVSTASTEFSERTQAQAQRLESTVAALARVVASVGESAKAATATHATVDAAHDTAERSAAIVRKAIEAMSEIGDSSQQIQQIIGVIDEIAFQTNLLALNAAVEAARAGDQGRGFAVVASEVRNLASRSSEAAKQVKTLIFRSSEQVEKGTALVGETGRALEGIARQVKGINEMVRDFTATAVTQADEVRAVSHALAEVDDLTQRNAAMIEESVTANEALANEAEALTRQIAQFRLAPGDASAPQSAGLRRSARG
jgi:methyl-accepting chemotaxis protein